MLWFALILPEPALQAIQRGSPDAAPLALVERHPRARVVAANAAARQLGITAGDSLAGALAVAPALELLEHDPDQARQLLTEVATWASAFTPAISIDPPDCVLLEVAASLQLFGGLQRLTALITRGLAELGLDARLACAPTPLAARWLARHRPGSAITETGALAQPLGALPLAALADGSDVSRAALELLGSIGVARLAEVAELPRGGLARRQAATVSTTLDRAFGRQPDPRPRFDLPQRYHARLPLLVPTERSDTLIFLARRLLPGLAGWLAGRHAGVDRFRFSLEHEGRHPATRLEIVCAAPSRDEAAFALLLNEHLGRHAFPGPVDALVLEADHPVALAAVATDLFDDTSLKRENAQLLLARLRARLGDEAIRALSPLADHRPERAWRLVPPGSNQPPVALADAPRPLWLLAEPKQLTHPGQLRLIGGPERIESGWWDDHDVRRDYFVAETPEGGRWWIFRELEAPRGWYLHGFFA